MSQKFTQKRYDHGHPRERGEDGALPPWNVISTANGKNLNEK